VALDLPLKLPDEAGKTTSAADELESLVRSQLENAVDAEKRSLKVYQSLHNLNEVIGTQYGDRVLYEFIQNAHDAHGSAEHGKISIRLVLQSDSEGVLYIANGGTGFRRQDVEAVRNLAISAKEIGEGIGNKGLGFRSVEALTDDVQVFSQAIARKTDRFDGYCFRFASVQEIEDLLGTYGIEPNVAAKVAVTIPRYLVPLPIHQQSDEILAFARSGYATVIAARLQSAQAVSLASKQVEALANLDVPLLLFLDRIGEIRIDMDVPGQVPYRRILLRSQIALGDIPGAPGCSLCEVDIGDSRKFLVVRRAVELDRVLKAVEASIPLAPQLKRWLNWKGEPVVSVAVGLNRDGVAKGRLYNFLPMGDISPCPLQGYLDAPFFADIDRRNADLALPLNEALMQVAAEACVASVLSIIERRLPMPAQAVFDLIAWTGDQSAKLDSALKQAGSSLRDAKIVPAIPTDGLDSWGSLSTIRIWPEGNFSVLRAADVARYVAASLVSSELDDGRRTRLKKIADRIYQTLSPTNHELADWAEAFSRSLIERKAGPRSWSRFYDDLVRLFEAAKLNLGILKDKTIILDHTGKLRSAAGNDSDSQAQVFVRSEVAKGKRSSGGIPMPPGTLIRRYRFIDEKIKLSRQTLDAFVRAGLLRPFDPLVALAGLKSTLGKNATDSRRQEALVWAFQVWRAAGPKVDDILRDADLHVLTLSGWHPASTATFSSSWTPVGRVVENYLFEVAEHSADCKHARELLLVSDKDWPSLSTDSPRQWVRFLEIIGVVDGIQPVASRMPRQGQPVYRWTSLLRDGKKTEGFDEDWCAEVANVSFYHPYTDYQMDGEAWRFPGQIEYDLISEAAREILCGLIFEHLKTHRSKFFQFRVGRFDRYPRDYDSRTLPTPLASFLRSKPWIAASTREGIGFRSPDHCWAAKVRRGGPPRFVDRVPDTVAALADHPELAEFVFSQSIGLRDWRDEHSAVARLSYLATIATDLASNDRPTFRGEYKRAWQEVAQAKPEPELPSDFSLVVTRRGQIETLRGDSDSPPALIVSQDVHRFEARVLSAAGRPVLEVGETSTGDVARLLESRGDFLPLRIDGIGVHLLVDGLHFVPSAKDPLLTSFGLEWLPEVLVIGHELCSEQLERGVPAATVDRKARAIRVRICEDLSLVVEGHEASPTEQMTHYAFENDDLPTLILTRKTVIDWSSLGRTLSGSIARLIDTRLRSLETLLLKLAMDHQTLELTSPSDEALASVMGCDVQTIQDHRLSLRTDLGRILHLLMPVVSFLTGAEMARQLMTDADQSGIKFNVRNWLISHLSGQSHTPDELLRACEKAGDRAEVRRLLDFEYAAFNRALISIGELPLSNETVLRQLYEAYLSRMSSEIVERLRRHHLDDFRSGRALDLYVERKSLVFLPFNSEWVLTRDTLEQEIVEQYASTILDPLLGAGSSLAMPSLARTLDANRKSVRSFVNDAMPIVRAWCRKNETAVPAAWQGAELHTAIRQIENNGLLDFEPISPDQMPSICRRADCWPAGMAETLSLADLKLGESELGAEEKRAEKERQQTEIVRRSINFGGASLDTADTSFSDRLREIADAALSHDETWLERSRQRVRLNTFEELDTTSGGKSRGGRGRGRYTGERQMTDAQRAAMGLSSEWLAYHFLLRRYPEYVNEASWVSGNRVHFFGGDEGDDSAGYDFLVKTPQADWLYEVKSSLEDGGEFELTANEIRVASGAAKDGRRRYRILYVPYTFSPDKWLVLELPNPMGERTRNQFETVGRGSLRLRFERR
jgi:Domain of unknown function (DUF3883)